MHYRDELPPKSVVHSRAAAPVHYPTDGDAEPPHSFLQKRSRHCPGPRQSHVPR